MSYTVRKKVKNKFNRLILVALGLYVMVGATLFLLQEKFLFRPTVLAQDHVYEFRHKFEELFINTSDDSVINAIHFQVDRPEGVILYFHGNAGNLARWGEVTEYFVDMNYDVLVMDYRSYGKSTGPLSEEGLFVDAQKCYNFLLQRYSESDITIYGRSIGSGMATKMASDNQPKQLILESPFYNVADVAKKRFPIFPVGKLLKYKFLNNKNILNVQCPVTIYHGTDDYIVPFSSGEKLYLVSEDRDVNFEPIEGAGHNNLIDFTSYRNSITKLLKQ